MVVVALALRLVVMGFTYRIQLDPAQDHWAFGWETGRVARSIATGQGFSSPYSEPTGPTALIPPVYTYLVAGVFKLFGIYTAASALVLLTLNNIFSSLTCLPVFSDRPQSLRPRDRRMGWMDLGPISLLYSFVQHRRLGDQLDYASVDAAGTGNAAPRTLDKRRRVDWLWLVLGLCRSHQPGDSVYTTFPWGLGMASALAARK